MRRWPWRQRGGEVYIGRGCVPSRPIGTAPLYASATADTVRLPSALHVCDSYLVSLPGGTEGRSAHMSMTGFFAYELVVGEAGRVRSYWASGWGGGGQLVASSEHSVHLEESCSQKKKWTRLYIFQSSWIRSGSGFYWVCFTEKREAATMETTETPTTAPAPPLDRQWWQRQRPEHGVTARNTGSAIGLQPTVP